MNDHADEPCASSPAGARTFHGVAVPDPHPELRNLESQATKDWVAAQERATDQFLAHCDGLPELRRFLERNYVATDPIWFAQRGTRRFHLARKPGLDQPVLCVTEAGRESVLLDPNPEKLAIRLEEVRVSASGRHVALLISPPGQVLGSIRVIDGVTGATLEESPVCTVMPIIAWHPREQGFYYSLCRKLFEEHHPQRDGLYWHALGQPWAADRCVKEYHDGPGHIAHATIAGDRIVLGTRQFSSGESGYAICALPDDPATAAHAPTGLFRDLEGYVDFVGAAAGELYFHTTVGAPNGRIVAVDPQRPGRAHWRDVVPDGDLALARPERFGGTPKAAVSGRGLLLTVVEHAHDALRHYGLDGALRDKPELPELSTIDAVYASADGYVVHAQSFITPRATYVYRNGTLAPAGRVPLPDVDPARYELRQEFVKARDGTPIPLYVMHARGLVRDGATPTLLYGYGGFGQSITPEYSPSIAAWLSLGGIFALGNIRGGGEYGERWARAGSGRNKQTCFDDFYDCAEHLVARRYTSPDHLVARGLSNGGLLTAVCANQRPDLFCAVATEVPLVDMLGLGDSSTGRAVAAEYGNPLDDREAFEVMRAYSPLHNTRSDVRTPAQFVVAAAEDVAAQPSQIYPYVAARQDAVRASGHHAPVLLRVIHGEGHNDWRPEATRGMIAEEIAFLHHFARQGRSAQVAQKPGLRAPMRDHVELVTNVWLPSAGGPFPVVLLRTPYDNDSTQFERLGLRAYVEAGYAVAIQSVRGRGGSGGGFSLFFAEGADGHDAIEWLARQPWCDGKVAMDGGSYLGTVQWLAARERPPHLACILPAVPGGDWFHEIPYMGGALQVDWAFSWLSGIAGRAFDFEATGDRNLEKYRPLADAERVLGPLPVYRDVVRHPPTDRYWQPLFFTAADFARVAAPVFTVTGWYDGDQAGTLRYWEGLRRANPALPAELIIGPWEHAQCYLGGEPALRELQLGEHSVLPMRRLRLAFLDEHLRGRPRPAAPRARVFVTGSNRWHDLDAYPPPADAQRWFLASGGRANTSAGDGRLTTAGAAGAADRFAFDPVDPVPYKPGAADHRDVEARADVLVYSSEVLAEPLTVLGPVEAELHVTSTAPDTDFTCKLLDVHPDGRAVSLTHVGGALRARYREGFDRAVALAPGQPAVLRIRLSHVGHTFRPGHRLRLEVSSSCFPMIDPNPNTGTDPATETRCVTAQQAVLHDPAHPSHLLLPIWR